MNRRHFSLAAAGLLATATVRDSVAASDPLFGNRQVGESGLPRFHDLRQPVVAMLLYPGMTLLDTLGPQTALCTSAKIHLVWKDRNVVVTDSGLGIMPTATLAECPKDLDVLFVGGGNVVPLIQDRECIDFIADRGARAKYVTSVCTGSLALGAAGLLRGYKATSHWNSRDALALFGAEPTDGRVVTDRNRMTGGGVTAGLDFGLTLLARLVNEDVAKVTQLAMEYDPAPPFHAGSPVGAGTAIVSEFKKRFGFASQSLKIFEEAAKRMPA